MEYQKIYVLTLMIFTPNGMFKTNVGTYSSWEIARGKMNTIAMEEKTDGKAVKYTNDGLEVVWRNGIKDVYSVQVFELDKMD